MDKLVDHLFVFEGDAKIKDYTGRYSDYRLELKEKEALEKQAEKQAEKLKNTTPEVISTNIEKPKNKLSYKEKFELEQLEKELPKLEGQKNQLTELLNSNITNHEELLKITQKLGYVTKQLDEKTDRWLVLSEL